MNANNSRLTACKIGKYLILFLFFSFFVYCSAQANNIQLKGQMNVTAVTNGVATLEFSMSWDNSWRDNYNWDAAWIILRYQRANAANPEWKSIRLKKEGTTVNGGYACQVNMTRTDTTGVLVYRSAKSGGTSDVQCSFKWPLPAELSGWTKEDFDDNKVFFLVQGIEMVYIPYGPYYLGDGESVNTLRQGYKRIIPAADDIIGTDASFVYSMNLRHYKNAVPSAAADRVNNSVWTDECSNISHFSHIDHGAASMINNSWMVDFKVRKTIRTFGVSGRSGTPEYPPAGIWYLQASNDNVAWDTVWTGGPEYYTHDVTSYPVQHGIRVARPDSYRYYRIFVPKIAGTSGMMLANVAMSEKDLFPGMNAPETAGISKIIPENKDIVNTTSGYSFSTRPSHYPGSSPAGPADHVNNSIWSMPSYNFAHISSTNHGSIAGVNNYWIVDFKTKKTVRTFGVSGSSNCVINSPGAVWHLLGSNDDAKWDTLWSGGQEYFTNDVISYPVQKSMRVQRPGAYRYYAVYVPKSAAGTNGILIANVSMSEEDQSPYAKNTFLVENEGKIALGDGVSQIYAEDGTAWTGELAAAYPKGYKGFYVMKYEVSQEQYARFLNALTLAQQQSLIAGLAALQKGEFIFGSKTEPTNRNGIVVSVPSDGTNPVVFNHDLNKNGVFGEDGDGMCVACNFMNLNDMLAYCAWAGLRPMSELEYEKASRRPYPDQPAGGEYAWNDALFPTKLTRVSNGGMRLERADGGNANFENGLAAPGPVRCGVFATAGSDQSAAGATFWGVMEMSGNLSELSANVKHAAFDGAVHGKGDFALNLWGTAPAGFSLRGGGFSSAASALRTSDRSAAVLTDLTARDNSAGFRGVFCPDSGGVVVTPGAITADNNLICSGSPVTLTGGEASVSDGSDLSFRYIWYVKVGDGSFRLVPEGAGTTFRCEDAVNSGSAKLKYTFKRKALCALGEAESNEVIVYVVNSTIRLSADTIFMGVCGKTPVVEVAVAPGVTAHFDWVYNGNPVDTGRVYIPQLSALGGGAGLYKYVVCKGNIEGCTRNVTVVIDFSKKEALFASELNAADCGRKVWDARDGQCYTTVNIPGTGRRPDQCWFSQNINIGSRVAGTDYSTHTVRGIQKVCYADKEENCEKYGGLYRWAETINGEKADAVKYISGLSGPVQGICPDGWHVPSFDEWSALEMNLGMDPAVIQNTEMRGTNQGVQMKESAVFNGINFCSGSLCNSSGFKGNPGGYCDFVNGTFADLGKRGLWWVATAANSGNAWDRQLFSDRDNVRNQQHSTTHGFSVRCIKNLEVASTAVTMENCGQVMVKDTREAEPEYYNTVKIPGTGGRPDQCWFGNNMNIGSVVAGADYNTHTVAGIQKICYNNDSVNCMKYGGLYNWNEAVNGNNADAVKYASGLSGPVQGICPDGWHIPDDNEWKALEMNLGMSQVEADKIEWRGVNEGTQMKMPGTFEGVNWCTGADCNKSGFNGLPGGARNTAGGAFSNLGIRAWWWSSTDNGNNAWARYLYNTNATIYRNGNYTKTYGFSVRCIKNLEVASTAVTMENCGQVMVKDTREAEPQYYNTVKIPGTGGRPDQCWFGNNMNIGSVVAGADYSTHTVAGIQKICYANNEVNCDKYGGLYNWDEAMNGEKANAVKYVSGSSGAVQGICPDGWHIPGDSEWKTLEMNLGMSQIEVDKADAWRGTNQGTQMKMPGTFEGVNWCTGADCNKSGFGALPGGVREYTGGSWVLHSIYAHWWSSTEASSTYSWYRYLYYGEARVHRPSYYKSCGFSIRCLKN